MTKYTNSTTDKMTISWIHENPSLFTQMLEGGDIKYKLCKRCYNFRKLSGIRTMCCTK